MGGAWGLFAADGSRRVRLQGAVTEARDAWHVWVGAAVGLLVGAFVALLGAAVPKLPWSRRGAATNVIIASLGTAIIGATIAMHGAFVVLWSRTMREWGVASMVALVIAVATILMLCVLCRESEQSEKHANRAAKTLAWARLTLLFIAASWALILIADPRYRGFPVALFFVPAVLSVCLALVAKVPACGHHYLRHESTFLAWALLLAAAAMVIQEGAHNYEALALAVCWALLAAPLLRDSMTRSG